MLIAILWLSNIVLDTGGQLAFKAASLAPRQADAGSHWQTLLAQPWLWLGIGCYLVEFLVWLAFLTLVPLSEGVLLGSINIVAIMLGGRVLFGERLSGLRIAGVLLIALGVAIVGVA
jgi:drug/metabolite transporter (DMT)-like permease